MKRYLLYILIVLFSFPSVLLATSFEVQVDTLHNSVNALEGKINFPSNIKVDRIYDGNSKIVIWIQRPTIDNKTSSISFSGITPGGFQGAGEVFRFSGNFSSSDAGRFTFSKVQALKNDGLGTSVLVKLSLQSTTLVEDSLPPEAFTPVISVSPNFFDGKPFVSFATTDKGVGVDHYEYALTRFFSPASNGWQRVESPLVLEKTDLSHRIFIKAVDRNGNEQISTVVAFYYYESLALWAIIIVFFIICVSFFIRRFLF